MAVQTSTMLQATKTTGDNDGESPTSQVQRPLQREVKSRRPKLHGRAFYESLGSPRVVLAPMVDQSEYAWRLLTRSYMPEGGSVTSSTPLLAYSPMFHSRLFCETEKYRAAHFEPLRAAPDREYLKERNGDHHHHPPSISSSPLQTPYLDGNPATDRPLIVQFCSNSPQDLLSAAQQVAPYCDAVDLNLGCPQGIARKGHYGAFLQEDWALIHQLISTLHHNLPIPVTAKIRILDTPERTLEYARMVLGAGASILTVHGRRREQKGHLTGLAEWSVIRYLRENLPKETVLFANGNVLGYEDVEKCLRETGADAVMSAEGNLHDPTIFRASPGHERMEDGYWRGKDGKGGYRMDAVLRRYLDIIYEHVFEKTPPARKPLVTASYSSLPQNTTNNVSVNDTISSNGIKCTSVTDEKDESKRSQKRNRNRVTSPNLVAMQPHLFNLLRPLLSRQTHIRDVLAKVRMGDTAGYERILEMVEEVTAAGLRAYDAGTDNGMEHCAKKIQALSEGRRNTQDDEGVEEETDQKNGHTVHERSSNITSAIHTNGDAIKSDYNKVPKDENSSAATIAHYKRPWWICQPYIRPLPAEAAAIGAVTVSKSKSKSKKSMNKTAGENGGIHGEEPRVSKKRDASAMEQDVTVDEHVVSNRCESKSKRDMTWRTSEADTEAVKGARQPEESDVILARDVNGNEDEVKVDGVKEEKRSTESIVRSDPVVTDTGKGTVAGKGYDVINTAINGNATASAASAASAEKEGVVYG